MSVQSQAKPRTLLFRPFHRSNSDRMLETTQGSPNPEYLNMPEQLRILSHSFIETTDENGVKSRRHTRYFQGCDTIFIDEQIEQDKRNGIIGRKIKFDDTIYIKGGLLEVTNEQATAQLFHFLETHNANVSNPNHIKPKGGYDSTAFEQIDYQRDATNVMNEMEESEMAYDLLNATKKGMGATREFNTDELNKLAKIFGTHKPSQEETYIALREIAQSDPRSFVNRIEQTHAVIVHDFENAKKWKALTYSKGAYSIKDMVVFTASGDNAKKHDAEFIEFLSTEKGSAVHNELRTQIQFNQLEPK